MDPSTVDVKHDAKVDCYAAQNCKAVNKGPVGCIQRDLQVDSKNQRRSSDDCEGLVVRGGFSILPHRLQERSVRDEEDDERDEDAMEQADEEVFVVEQCPLLAGQVQLGEFQAQFVVNVLVKKSN